MVLLVNSNVRCVSSMKILAAQTQLLSFVAQKVNILMFPTYHESSKICAGFGTRCSANTSCGTSRRICPVRIYNARECFEWICAQGGELVVSELLITFLLLCVGLFTIPSCSGTVYCPKYTCVLWILWLYASQLEQTCTLKCFPPPCGHAGIWNMSSSLGEDWCHKAFVAERFVTWLCKLYCSHHWKK